MPIGNLETRVTLIAPMEMVVLPIGRNDWIGMQIVDKIYIE